MRLVALTRPQKSADELHLAGHVDPGTSPRESVQKSLPSILSPGQAGVRVAAPSSHLACSLSPVKRMAPKPTMS